MKSFSTIFALVLLIACTSTSSAQVNWKKYEGNPIVEVGSEGSWNEAGYGSGDVLFDGETYHGWIAGTPDGEKYQIGYFTSTDGTNWTEYEGNPVLEVGEAGKWDDQSVQGADVHWDGETYHMWYTGTGDNIIYSIGYATSPDGATWTRYAGNPVLEVGAVGSWEEDGVLDPCIILEDTTYHMWYEGANWPYTSIGFASSTDRVNWTRYENNPVLTGDSGSWDYLLIKAPEVYFDGTTYHMWYSGGATWSWNIGYADSPDGIIWTKSIDNRILKRGETGEWDDQYVGYGAVVADTVNNEYKMWYGGGTEDVKVLVGYATSPDTVVTALFENKDNIFPGEYFLYQNFPNPFNPSTTIEFQIPNSKFTTLKVYNILGKEVAKIVSNNLNAGVHQYQFDSAGLASGIYYYQIVAGEYRDVKKMILLR